jgi:transcriptional regulator of acetoin/glycerol metabolism
MQTVETPPAPRSLAEIGRAAMHREQKAALLAALEANGWLLEPTAAALGLYAAADVVRALRKLAPTEYEAARRDGRISRRNRAQ